MHGIESRMKVKVKATGETGTVYGPVAGSGASFRVLELGQAITQPIATEWDKWHVSLSSGRMDKFHPFELEEIDEDEKTIRERHERAEAEWQKFLQRTYGSGRS